jgi:K+-sensing histidine kinase KdpD
MRSPDLLRSVCHDLRAPLASIVMGAGFLRRALPPEDLNALRVVEAMRRAADGMNRVITTFADLSRLQMHELALEIAPHDVASVVKAVFDELVADPAAQGVAVSLELDPGIPPLPCDRERLVQVLRQLAEAAVRVVPDRGTIELRATARGSGAVRFEVVVRRHPDPGSRSITMDPPSPALALARGLVALHGGSLSVVRDGDTCTLSFDLSSPGGVSPEPAPVGAH